METKNVDDFVLKELDFLGPNQYHNLLIPPERPASGGLAVFWKQDIQLQLLSSNKNIIDTEIKHKGVNVFASFVYGEPDAS